MNSSKLVWYPDDRYGFCVGRLVDLGGERASVEPLAAPSSTSTRLEPLPCKEPIEAAYKSLYPCCYEPSELASFGSGCLGDCDDCCALVQLHEPALLENVRVRFQQDKIYTYVAHILIAVNPYYDIDGLHSTAAIGRYQGKSLGTLAPHVYAIADKAYRDMKAFRQSQSIIISGESGAGKTESQKHVLRYLCLSGSQSGRLEKLILDANPILEAFGNAKTIRNNNSSRFGKFIEIHYSNQFTVTGGLFFHYLLEKTRICIQSPGERNYHVFYQLCACLPQDQWNKLELKPPDQFRYLNSGCTQYFCSSSSEKRLDANRKSQDHLRNGPIQDQLIDDLVCYEQTDRALSNFGVDEQQKNSIYSIVAAVLHLGNVSFVDCDPDDKSGACQLESGEAQRALTTTAKLMGLDRDLLSQALTTRVMSTARGGHKGTIYMVQLNVQQAQAARDALAKAIYSRLFDYIVTKIVNKSIPFNSSAYYIGVLDVAGFEYFQHNSFEQFLINFCNEKLQQFFNERILKEEQNIYDNEGLNLPRVDFVDNQDCIQLFETKSIGIFDLLDEESRLPKPNSNHFTQSVHERNRNHIRLAVPRVSKLKWHREIRDDEGFLVRHFAGSVCYETGSFIEKNNDALHGSLKILMQDANHDLLRELFANPTPTDGGVSDRVSMHQQQNYSYANVTPKSSSSLFYPSSSSSSSTSNKLNFVSVSTTFRSQLANLMHKLRSTGSHFIRCLKPNNEMVAHKFEGAQILNQLHCSGMFSVLKLMQQGYPSRSSFNELYQSYRNYLPNELARLDSHLFCRALFKALGLNDTDFHFGSSKVFFRPGKFAEFDQIVRSDGEHVAKLVKKVSKWLIGFRWRKIQYCCLSVIKLNRKILYRRQLIIKLQSHWRSIIIRSKSRFMLNALKTGRNLANSLVEFKQIIGDQVKKPNERASYDEQIKTLQIEVDNFIESIRNELKDLFKQDDNNNKLNNFSTRFNTNANERKSSNQQKLDMLTTKCDLLYRSIRDRIAKQQELFELEQRIAAENKRREQEELARSQEIQMKLKRNELELKRQQEIERLNEEKERRQANNQATLQRKNFVDSNESSQLETSKQQVSSSSTISKVTTLPPSENHSNLPISSKYDLSKWKYSDLRDTINTSCDLELLEACKREFHRRLKVYHAWRARNARWSQIQQSESRAPSSVLQSGADSDMDSSSLGSESTPSGEQRYFRIPFVKSSAGQRGWWYAHFDGQWIARQLELHPDREPILLVAGQNDLDMCELSLKETRLTSKRGAEILPQEFEEEWTRHGGEAYRQQSAEYGRRLGD